MGSVAQQTGMQCINAFKITLDTANWEQFFKKNSMQGILKQLNPNKKEIATVVQYFIGDYKLWWCFN